MTKLTIPIAWHRNAMNIDMVYIMMSPNPVYTDEVGKSKVFPYSLPSVKPEADPGVQAVSPQVTV